MDNLNIPMNLLPKGIIQPAAFIAGKNPALPDYGVDTGDLVIIDSGIEFVRGELFVFQSEEGSEYRLSKEKSKYFRPMGKVVMIMKYYGCSPFEQKNSLVHEKSGKHLE